MEPVKLPLLLIPAPPEPQNIHVQVPRSTDNLFERLIRDPQAPHRPMRERQCSEMLRAVLVASPNLMSLILKWLAEQANVPIALIDELSWSLETEQPIGTKRDDLRIEGWRETEDSPQCIVLWTIEIKVAAPLHESSLQDASSVTEEEPELEIVNQLVNYDNWLADQTADYRAGFVLALRNMSANLPPRLTQPWYCTTWTQLALQAEAALATDLLPVSERPFARHMLGFIRNRLWDTTDMSNSRLELDDVALLRALAAIGPACASKLKGLVGQFKEVFEAADSRFLDIKPSSSFFDRMDTVQHSMSAKCTSDRSWLGVSAGVVADDVRVWISCNPTVKETKQAVRRILLEHQTELTDRNPAWCIVELDAAGYIDAEISKPLVSVLADDDWQKPLLDFVQEAVNDLKATGVLQSIVSIGSSERQV